MPEVFAKTTPLQDLHRLGRLDWRREFSGRIVVPTAVADELEAGRRLGARVPELAEFPWIEIRRPAEPMPAFPRFIHRGEAEVLVLARTAAAPLVTNRAFIAAATQLYVDATTQLPRSGSGGKTRGAPRRLADFCNQLDVTWDLYAMEAAELIEKLPKEFDRFRRAA